MIQRLIAFAIIGLFTIAAYAAPIIIPDVVSPPPVQPKFLFLTCPLGAQNFAPYREKSA